MMKYKIKHRFTGQIIFEGSNLSSAIIKYGDFSNMDLSGLIVSGANFSGANFSGANFSDADFSDADFRGANFSGANFSDADFRGANFSGADFRGANFSGANFSGANFSGADFSDADFSDANFSDANFSGADFSGAYFSGAYFGGANFSGASFDFDIPTIKNIHQAIYKACSVKYALDMGGWHPTNLLAPCGTAHCRAGQKVHLCGKAGYALEDKVGTLLAAKLILRDSSDLTFKDNQFYVGNDEALKHMKMMAKMEIKNENSKTNK